MTWQPLTELSQLDALRQESYDHPVLILKHSTRCSISSTVFNRLERQWNAADVGTLKPYFLDLIAYRAVSNAVAEQFGVRHESPQVLFIQNGECVYDASHLGISFANLKEQMATV
jgi:bacillithiol system protein YtxJ